METHNNRLALIISLTISVLIHGCESGGGTIDPKSIDKILENWQFVSIEVNGKPLVRVKNGFEPSQWNLGGYWIPWFWYEYNSDGSYEFRSDLASTPLGYDENYQPKYGYWEWAEEKKLLIHNKGMPYEKSYHVITLNDTSFVREYDRIVKYSPDTTLWKVGEVLTYREILEKRKGPCCD